MALLTYQRTSKARIISKAERLRAIRQHRDWIIPVRQPDNLISFSRIRAQRSNSRVTDDERRKAILHSQDTAKLVRLGTEQMTLVGAKVYRAVMKAYRSGGTISRAVEQEMKPMPELLKRGMAIAHLHGKHRVQLNAKKAGASTKVFRRTGGVWEGAVEWLRRRMETSREELAALEELYSAKAIRISKGLETWVDSKMERAAMDVVQQGMTTREGTRVMAEAMMSVGMIPPDSATATQWKAMGKKVPNAFMAENLFRTQTSLAYGAAHWQENQEEWVQEILWGYKYVTVGDDRVRPEHEALEGTTAPKDDPIWLHIWTPNGWACRCSILDLFNEREIWKPGPQVELPTGEVVTPGPDKGFDFNPGLLFAKAA